MAEISRKTPQMQLCGVALEKMQRGTLSRNEHGRVPFLRRERFMIQLAIFDLDGTLLNTLGDLHTSTNAALRQFGYPTRTLEEVRQFVGNGIRLLIQRAVPQGLSEEEIDRVHQFFLQYYAQHCADCTEPYPGILELLHTLRQAGVKTAIASNKADAAVNQLAEHYFPGLFDEAVGERAGVPKKPAPDCVHHLLQDFGVEKAQAVYIGDSEVDVETAQNAGVPLLAVSWGFRSKNVLQQAGAGRIVDTAEELCRILLA
jgi:phosphoglycolate phosphatase